jgi:hypothetical protein
MGTCASGESSFAITLPRAGDRNRQLERSSRAGCAVHSANSDSRGFLQSL